MVGDHTPGGLWGRDPIPPYQRSTAEQDHEDNETFKPAVLHDAVAGLAQPPPDLPVGLCGVHGAAGTAADTAWGRERAQTQPGTCERPHLIAGSWTLERMTESGYSDG